MTSTKFLAISIACLLYACSFVTLDRNDGNIATIKVRQSEVVPVPGSAIGPESFAFDPTGGGPYTGLSDGRVVKWIPSEQRWIDFAVTSPTREGCEGPHDHDQTEHICGRPLGLMFGNVSGDLYIADSYMGLLKVGHEGGLASKVAMEAEGVPLGFTNSLDIDPLTGDVYFTDSSSVYQRRKYISLVISGDRTGRLMKYEPKTKQVKTLQDNLSFANGVALSEDGEYILVAETTNSRVLRCWVKTSKCEIFAAQLPGFPDNIKRSPRGGFWVGLHSRKNTISEWVIGSPWVGKILARLPVDLVRTHSSFLAKYRASGLAVRLSEGGEIVEMVDGGSGKYKWSSISEVKEKDGVLWIGSVNSPVAEPEAHRFDGSTLPS